MRKIAVPDEGIETLFGSYDENLRHLESLFDVRIRTQRARAARRRGSGRRRQGRTRRRPARRPAARGLQLRQRRREDGGAACVAEDRERRPARPLPEGQRSAPSAKRQVAPKSLQPAPLSRRDRQHDIVFGVGPAGTGKTYLAMAQAVVVPAREEGQRGSSWRGRRSKPARSSASCPAICRRRSIRICARSTTRSTTCSTPSASSGCSSAARSRSRRSRSCAAAR